MFDLVKSAAFACHHGQTGPLYRFYIMAWTMINTEEETWPQEFFTFHPIDEIDFITISSYFEEWFNSTYCTRLEVPDHLLPQE